MEAQVQPAECEGKRGGDTGRRRHDFGSRTTSWRAKGETMKEQAVLVTTIHRGVFFGYTNSEVKKDSITIKNARNCIYWSADVKGFLGLASNGPTSSCKIGPKVPSLKLLGVTAVVEVTPEAIEKWEKSPWSL
jgi:hypothetical protein